MNTTRARGAGTYSLRNVLTISLTLLVVGPSLFANWDEGLAAFNAGRYDDAAAKFRTVVEQSPDAPAGYYMLGLAQLRGKQPAQALAALGKAVELGPDDPRYRLTFAQAQLQARQPDSALKTLTAQDPKAVPEANRQAFSQLVAKAATESKDTRAALAALEKQIDSGSRSKTMWLAVAHVAQKANQPQKAYSALTAAYELDRSDAELGRRAVHTAFAAAQKQNGNTKQGWYEKGFETARKWAESSGSAEAYLMAGQARIGAKDYAGARTWFDKAAGAEPGNAQPYYEQARCDLALKEADAALGHLSSALERSPDADLKRQIFLAEGFAYRIREDFVKAGQAFEKAGDSAKVAEMAELQERKEQNKLFEKEKADCLKKVAEVEKLKEEMKDLKGTDAWDQLEADAKAIATACAAHLKDS